MNNEYYTMSENKFLEKYVSELYKVDGEPRVFIYPAELKKVKEMCKNREYIPIPAYKHGKDVDIDLSMAKDYTRSTRRIGYYLMKPKKDSYSSLSVSAKRTMNTLIKKINGDSPKIPTALQISNLLTELHIPHTITPIERRKMRNIGLAKTSYLGDRVYKGFLLDVYDLQFDTTIYTSGTINKAIRLKEIIDSKLKEK